MFIIEVEDPMQGWTDIGVGIFNKAKEAYPVAREHWRKAASFVRAGFQCREYWGCRYRVRRIGGKRAAHVFPNLRIVYDRSP